MHRRLGTSVGTQAIGPWEEIPRNRWLGGVLKVKQEPPGDKGDKKEV